jgi:hypothetical protein
MDQRKGMPVLFLATWLVCYGSTMDHGVYRPPGLCGALARGTSDQRLISNRVGSMLA